MYGATGAVRATGCTVRDATAVGGAVMATEPVYGTERDINSCM